MVRAKVEYPFRVIKRQFGHLKTRYRGLVSTAEQFPAKVECALECAPGAGQTEASPIDRGRAF